MPSHSRLTFINAIPWTLPRPAPRTSPILISRIPSSHISGGRLEGPVWLSAQDKISVQLHILEAEQHVSNLRTLMITMNVRQDSPLHKEVVNQLNETLDEIAQLRNILSPIRRVPLEILTEIFRIYCLLPPASNTLVVEFISNPNAAPPFTTSDFIRPRFVITGVCTAWRKAALCMPLIWSKLKICQVYQSRTSPRMIREWLSRSGSSPIELDLTICESATSILATALSFSFRIRSLRLSGPVALLLPIFHIPSSSFPSLETLRIDIPVVESRSRFLGTNQGSAALVDPFGYLQEKFPNGIKCFSGSGHLVDLEIAEHGEVSLLELMTLPLASLKALKIEASSAFLCPSVYLSVLRRTTNLVHFKFRPSEFLGYDGRILLNHFSHPISLPYLNSLDISFSFSSAVVAKLFQCLITPSLTRLRLLTLTEELDTDLTNQLLDFQQRSAVSLTSLHLGGVEGHMEFSRLMRRIGSDIFPQLDAVDLDAALIYSVPAAFSNITSLYIQENAHDLEPFLRAMAKTTTIVHGLTGARTDITDFLPNLEELWLYLDAERCGPGYFNLILTMLKSRSRPTTLDVAERIDHFEQAHCQSMRQLKKARIHIHGSVSPIPVEAENCLAHLRRMMDLRIWKHSDLWLADWEKEQLEVKGVRW
ncbi:hypothetical protein GYMLUDRAFT_261352 [Collybiopsis luxurians FD-317 M1]|uniref:F-box domain-containing protein n=1 Tax=Collybiopsis luxurians FD-317 M1 TaxID=944289 RepID=A0A0D0BXA9_9AGAR|nr:hypothetical protein GYMLUDRAFT_261352 [Collybiopsis luxurians FD-317 M1]